MTRIFVVDAFAEAPFTGNPAAVVPDAASLSDVAMQDIAAEMNLSETAFLIQASGARRLRWFSPVHEVAFCGHATIATAHVLSAELGLPGPFLFETRVGALRVETGADGLVLEVPRLEPEPDYRGGRVRYRDRRSGGLVIGAAALLALRQVEFRDA